MGRPNDAEEKELAHEQVVSESSPTTSRLAAPDDNDASPSLARVASGPPYSIFSKRTKIFVTIMVSISALISPFAATMFYPALNVLAEQLDVTDSMITLSITTYMIAQAVAPAFLAGISDQNGRRPSFIICFIIFIVANIGLALQTNYAALLVLRMLQASGSSGTIALSIAVVADISTSAERGKFMGYALGGLLVGPAVGPTIGGGLSYALGWRSTFWFLVIFTTVLLVVYTIFCPETCRTVVGNGSIPARGIRMSVLGRLQQRKESRSDVEEQKVEVKEEKRKFVWPNPLRTLKILGEKESAVLLLYNGFFFNGFMSVSAAMSHIFKTYYGYNELYVGLCFLPVGAGALLVTLISGRIVDRNFRRHAKKVGLKIVAGKQQDLTNFPVERARLEVVAPAHVIGTLAIITFGWTIDFVTHVSGPLIMLFFVGAGFTAAFNTSNTLLIDLHRDKPATATAAVNFTRCMISAGGVAAIVPMIQAWGPGWCFTFWGLLYVAFMPAIWALVKFGPSWRRELQEKKEMGKAEEL